MADRDLMARRDSGDQCPGMTPRPPLSCDRIVDAAVRYVDHDCLDGLSMRRLGAELGVEAMSLYRYFPSKAALLGAVICRMLADVALPGPEAGVIWEDAVHAYARSFRAVCVTHPRLLPLLATMGPGNPTLASIEGRMTAFWREAGFDASVAAQAQAALQGYVTGACLHGCPGTDQAEGAFELGLDALVSGLRLRLAGAAAPA